MLQEVLKRTGPELVVVFVQGSGAKRQSCWLIDMHASLRCWPPHKSTSHTHRCSSHPQINSYTQIHMQTHACALTRIHRRAQKYSTNTYAHIDLQLSCICLVVFFFFFPCGGSPPHPCRVGGKRSPRGRTAALIDSREFGGRGASKTALLLSLSSRPLTPQQLARFHLPTKKINTSFSE